MKYLNSILNFSLFVVLAVMVSVMGANVMCRFFLKFSIYWADELVQSLMLWLTFLGAAVAIREHSHYTFNYIEEHLKGSAQKIFSLTNKFITMFAICLLLYWSVEVTYGISTWVMPALNISRAWVYGACPVGCIFMLIYCVLDLVMYFKNKKI